MRTDRSFCSFRYYSKPSSKHTCCASRTPLLFVFIEIWEDTKKFTWFFSFDFDLFFFLPLHYPSRQSSPTSHRWITLFQTVRFIIMVFLLCLLVLLFLPFRNTSFSSRQRRRRLDLWLLCVVLLSGFLTFDSYYSTPSNWIPKATTSSHELLIELLPHFTLFSTLAFRCLVNNDSQQQQRAAVAQCTEGRSTANKQPQGEEWKKSMTTTQSANDDDDDEDEDEDEDNDDVRRVSAHQQAI